MYLTYSEFVGKNHEEKTIEFIKRQLDAQDHLEWTLGMSEPLRLPVHPKIEDNIYEIRHQLSSRLKIPEVANQIKKAKYGELNLSPLYDQSNIQIDLLVKVNQKEGFAKDTFCLSDDKMVYELKLPCILQVEATSSNYPNRIFDKFLRGTINAQHIHVDPIVFFSDFNSRHQLSQYRLYHLIVTGNDWIRGLENLKLISRIVFEENDQLMKQLPNCPFLNATLVQQSYLKTLTHIEKKKTEKCLRYLPFGLLNLDDLNVHSDVKLVNGRPRFEKPEPIITPKDLHTLMINTIAKLEHIESDHSILMEDHQGLMKDYQGLKEGQRMIMKQLQILTENQNKILSCLPDGILNKSSSKNQPVENHLADESKDQKETVQSPSLPNIDLESPPLQSSNNEVSKDLSSQLEIKFSSE